MGKPLLHTYRGLVFHSSWLTPPSSINPWISSLLNPSAYKSAALTNLFVWRSLDISQKAYLVILVSLVLQVFKNILHFFERFRICLFIIFYHSFKSYIGVINCHSYALVACLTNPSPEQCCSMLVITAKLFTASGSLFLILVTATVANPIGVAALAPLLAMLEEATVIPILTVLLA